MRLLKTTSSVIDALYGDQPSANKAFAKLVTTPKVRRRDQHVSNYRSTGIFPSDTYLICIAALKKKGCTAPPSLWGIAEPTEMRRAG